TLHRRPARRILRCVCGLVFIDPLPSEAEVAAREAEAFRGELLAETRAMFDAYGRGYRDDDPVVRAFAGHLATLGRLTAGRRLLDVGVGTGLLVHLARQAGWDATGVDICAEAAERAAREFGVAVAVGDFLAADLPGGYDAITMADVVEHSRDPRAFLARAHALLAPAGVLYVGVPNHRSLVYLAGDALGRVPGTGGLVDRLYVPNHYQYFTPQALEALAREAGFTIAALERENSYLGRYELSPVVRGGLTALLAASRAVGMESRLALFARRA
ncbi:MAG TPA: class I SAM-dependent methyltransferase, partial [Verrucomicrobiae bacterium]|nr:class I SAM-dependent methyltransferase [Verrucomicrobiae bacterium]